MQNKKLILIMGVLVLVVGAAAFVAGRMLNGQISPLSLFGLGGKGGMMTISIQVTPAAELPTTQPEVIGSFVERKDNTIVIQSVSMEAGKGGGYILQTNGPGEAVAGSPLDNGGPKVEVIINNETRIYFETTQPPNSPSSGENQVLQQTVEEGSLDDLTSQSSVSVWGRKNGDRIIAEVVFISNPIMIKIP